MLEFNNATCYDTKYSCVHTCIDVCVAVTYYGPTSKVQIIQTIKWNVVGRETLVFPHERGEKNIHVDIGML